MKSRLSLKLAIPYLLITVGLIIWIMTKSGDTPIGAALFVSAPWGFFFFEKFKGMPEYVMPLVNIGFNTILLYILGLILEKSTQKKNSQSMP